MDELVSSPQQPGGTSTRPTRRERNPDVAREDILDCALEEFADKGLSGARIDEIVERTATSKRMIYYYFGSKDGLYRAVLDREYRRIRTHEAALDLDALAPLNAIAELVRYTFDWHHQHVEFVRLVMNENIHRAVHLAQMPELKAINDLMIDRLSRAIRRGTRAGVFRSGIDGLDLHITISALCFYPVSNRYSVLRGFGRDMALRHEAERRREQVVETVLAWCRR